MRTCKNIKLVKKGLADKISQALSGIQVDPKSDDFDFEQIEEKVAEIYSNDPEYDDIAGKDFIFNEVLSDLGFGGYNFNLSIKQQENVARQLQIEALDHKKYKHIFLNADNVLAHMNQLLMTNMFKYTFVNRSKKDEFGRDITDHMVIGATGFNKGIVAFKNYLVGIIAKNLGLDKTDLSNIDQNPIFTIQGANENQYKWMMNSVEVSKFLDKDKTNPVEYTEEDMDTFSALYILNNFDTLIIKELGSLINIQLSEKGTLGNTQYSKTVENESTTYWLADTEDAKSSERFLSHMAKFIVSTLHKVNDDPQNTDSKYKFLSTADLFMTSDILKEAEYEYSILHPEADICFLENPKKALKFLLSEADWTELPVMNKFKKELLPFKRFLYQTSDQEYSIAEIFDMEQEKCASGELDILPADVFDIEGLLAFEINKNIAPTYLQYSEDAVTQTRNYSKSYKASGFVLDQIIVNTSDFLTSDDIPKALTALNVSFGNPGDTNNPSYSFHYLESLNDKKTKRELVNLVRNNKDSEFNELFQLVFGVPVSESIIQDLGEDKFLEKVASLFEIISVPLKNIYTDIQHGDITDTDSIFPVISEDLTRALKKDSNYQSLAQAIAFGKEDQPYTNFSNYSDASIPVYRLNSAAFNDLFFIRNYKKNNKDLAKKTNFLFANPHVFSRLNKKEKGQGSITQIINYDYLGSTGIKLDIGSPVSCVDAHTASAEVTFKNNFIGDFISLAVSKNICGIQPTEFSDKSSVLDKFVNLLAEVSYTSESGVHTGVLGTMNNTELERMFYYYRKNQVLDLVQNVLKKWEVYFNGEVKSISDSKFQKLLNKDYLTKEDSAEIKELWNKCSEKVEKLTLSDTQKKIAELEKAGTHFELVQELDYTMNGKSWANKALHLNGDIKYMFDLVSSEEEFKKWREELLDSLKYRDVIKDLPALLQRSLHQLAKDNPEFRSLYYDENDNYKGDSKEEYIPTLNELVDALIKPKMPTVFTNGKLDWDLLLERYLLMDNLISTAYIDLTVKEPYIDVPKGKFSDPKLAAENRYEATTKRMVILPGTVENFIQGLKNGVPTQIKVAIVDDPKEETSNLKGEKNNQDIFDGSGYISPVYSRLENNSLPGRGIKGTKKTLGMFTSDYASTLFKWAEFEITNTKIRNSIGGEFSLFDIMKKMHNIPFNQEINITKDYNGQDIYLRRISNGKRVFYTEGLFTFEIEDMEYIGGNQYIMYRTAVDAHGNKLAIQPDDSVLEKSVTINSLFDLWQAFGGCESQELVNGELEYSELSLDILTNYVNNVGTIENGVINQTLKDKMISILANSSAIKRGAVNVNAPENVWKNSESNLNWFTINTNAFGIQLDANHHIDMSELTEMSQTISALASKGYTQKYANDAYQEIGNIIYANTVKLSERVSQIENSRLIPVLQALSKEFVEELAKEDKISLAQNLAEKLKQEMGFILPFSNPNFYNLLVKNVLVDLNRSALKRKYTGSGNIMNPTSNVLQLYDLDGDSFLKTDLITKARRLFGSIDTLYSDDYSQNLTTEELAKLYLISKGSKGPEIVQKIQSGEINISNIREQVIDKFGHEEGYGLEKINPREAVFQTAVTYSLKSDPTKFYTKKLTILSNSKKGLKLDIDGGVFGYQDFINAYDQIGTAYINQTIPHDLLPQDIFWKVDNLKQSVFGLPSVGLSGYVSDLMEGDLNIESEFAQLEEDGDQLENTPC